MDKKIESLVLDKKFIQAIDIFLSHYARVSSAERISFDHAITALEYFQPYEHRFPHSPHDLYFLWKDFDRFLIEKKIYTALPITSLLAQCLMKEIFSHYNAIAVGNTMNNVADHIMYATSMIWLGEIRNASFILNNLIKDHPLEAEVWGLCGKIYDLIGDKKKSQIFYREAFFINPSILNLIDVRHYFVNNMITCFLQDLEPFSVIDTKEDLLEWLGISGLLGGFFPILQDLTESDKQLLDRRVSVYESHPSKGNKPNVKLLRLYLFKYDYYKAVGNSVETNSIRRKIELLSPLIYNKL